MSDATDDSTSIFEQEASDIRSIKAREPVRNQLAADVEAFLARGGSIQEVPRDVRTDLPKRPENSYGRGAI